MKGLLLDNWTLENIAFNCIHDKEDFSNELITLVEVIVLWDDVYYFDNGRTYWKTVLSDNNFSYICDLLKPVSVTDRSFYLANAEREYLKKYSDSYSSVVAQGAIEFLNLANDLSLSYMPFEKRAKFIAQHQLRNINDLYNRNKIFEKIEDDVKKYYLDLNNIIAEAKVSIKPHLLFNYVSNRCNSISDLIKSALELKEYSNVQNYKEWVTEFENKLANGDLTQLTNLLNDIKKIENEIIYGSFKEPLKPAFNAGFNFLTMQPSFGLTINLMNLIKRSTNKVPPNLVFPMFIFGKGVGKYDWSIRDTELKF